MILQTLYQNCVRHSVEFYSRFYVLDLILVKDEGQAPPRRRRLLRPGNRRGTSSKLSRDLRIRRLWQIFKTTSNAHTLW